MAKSKKPSKSSKSSKSTNDASHLLRCIAAARKQRHPEQALELARQLVRQAPTPPHRDLLREMLLEVGMMYQLGGQSRKAAATYEEAVRQCTMPDQFALLAERFASSGALPRAMKTLELLPVASRPAVRTKIVGHAADFALAEGPEGRKTLPPEHQAAYDHIVQAFRDSTEGRDDAARDALHKIGLQSPFLPWKIFLRGLFAYYAGDDARALENWSRLDKQRLPYRMSAPFRFHLDPAYAQAQKGDARAFLVQAAARLVGSPALAALHGLKTALLADNLAPAFRLAEQAVPDLRRDFPALVPRLADVFYWTIVHHGLPEDVGRFQRVFGALRDDPHLSRLQALAQQEQGLLVPALKAWERYVKEIAADPATWPGSLGSEAQALVWHHMGTLALAAREKPESEDDLFLPFFMQPRPKKPKPKDIKPSPEDCLRHAIELAPERLESYVLLMALHLKAENTKEARAVGTKLLQRFPDDVKSREAMGDLCLAEKDVKAAVEHFEAALRANPLERRLRGKLGRAQQNLALAHVLAGNIDAARPEYEAALALLDGPAGPVLYQWAAAELKAGDPARAEELLTRARAAPAQRLAAPFALACEATRVKLPLAQRKPLDAQFDAALNGAEPATPAEVLELLHTAALQRTSQIETYRGQKTQERGIVKFTEKISLKEFSEPQLEKLAAALGMLDARKAWERCLREGSRRFPNNAALQLGWVDYLLTKRDPSREAHPITQHLKTAHKVAEALPRGEQQQQLLEGIRRREERQRELGAEVPALGNIFDAFFNSFGDDFDDDFDEDE